MNNKLEVIGIDHGWSMMKTVTQVFVTGVKEITTTPALFGDVLEYDGKYYKIGTVRQEVKDTKVEDDSFYLLTLAAVAKELKKRGLSDAKVFLAVGLPLTRFGAERNNFIKYLTKNKRVDFRYENEAYHIEIDDVAVFPQCYAAVVDKIPTMAKKTLVVDIGSWTIDIMPVINKSPDESKCVTVPRGLITCMTRFRRCKSLGDMYCEEAIRDRIVKEDIAFYKSKQDIPKVSIVKCRVKRYRRAGLSGLQKKHYAKLYRVGKLKKRPYSQVWKYREDIRKMHKLQEQYLFLARHNIHSAEELVGTIASLTDKKKETSAEKSRIYKARERSMELFTAADEMENLKPAEQSYRLGDIFFEDEHRKWVALEQELQAQGYSLEEVQALRRHYKEEYSEVCAREKVVCRELNTGKAILNSMIPDSISDGRKTEYNREIIRDRKEQPVR